MLQSFTKRTVKRVAFMVILKSKEQRDR